MFSLLLQSFLGFLALCRSCGGMVVPFLGFDTEADELSDVEVKGCFFRGFGWLPGVGLFIRYAGRKIRL